MLSNLFQEEWVPPFEKWVLYIAFKLGKILYLVFFHFAYVIDLSSLVSKSAHWLSNLRQVRFYRHLIVGRCNKKWPKNCTKIQCYDQEFEKTIFKMLFLRHGLTVLLENLQKGTYEECNKFNRSVFLNFSFWRYL